MGSFSERSAREGQDSKKASLFPLYLAVFIAVLGFSLVAPIFPLYIMGLGASYTLLGVVISIYGAVQLAAQVPAGRLSDRVGRKPLLLIGLLTFALTPHLYLLAETAEQTILIRAFGGVGASMIWPIAMAMIIDSVRWQKRGSAMGAYNASFYSALAVGPVVGGYLYDRLGLAAPFQLWAALAIISMILVFFKVSETASNAGKERDEKAASEKKWPFNKKSACDENISNDEKNTNSVCRSPPVILQGRIASRTLKKEPMVVPGFMMSFLACCGLMMWAGIVGGFNLTLLPALAARLGLSTTSIGLLYLVHAGTNAVSNVGFGRLADKGRRRLLITSGCLLGTAAFALLGKTTDLTALLLILAALGLALGMASPAASAIVSDVTSSARRGEIFGVFNTARMAGVVAGPLIAGITADAGGIDASLFVFTWVAAAVAVLSLVIREHKITAN